MSAIDSPPRGLEGPGRLGSATEEFLAELTDAAYRVALKHKFQGSFVDVQLELWAALRKVVAHDLAVRCRRRLPNVR